MDGVQLTQGYSHFEEAVYFLPLTSQKFLLLILSTSDRPLSHTVVLNMGPLRHWTIEQWGRGWTKFEKKRYGGRQYRREVFIK